MCSITQDERIKRSNQYGQNSTILYRRRLFRLDPSVSDQIQFVLEPDLELFLGIGLIRNQEYVGLYFNLTAWNREDYEPTNIIQLTLSRKNENGIIEAGSHLIIIDDSSCDQTNAEQLSD